MRKPAIRTLTLLLVIALAAPAAFAQTADDQVVYGKVTGKTVLGGLGSLLLWPGIGQAVNENEKKKIVTHAILGLTGIFRFWSGWDALIDRRGGRWDGKI